MIIENSALITLKNKHSFFIVNPGEKYFMFINEYEQKTFKFMKMAEDLDIIACNILLYVKHYIKICRVDYDQVLSKTDDGYLCGIMLQFLKEKNIKKDNIIDYFMVMFFQYCEAVTSLELTIGKVDDITQIESGTNLSQSLKYKIF